MRKFHICTQILQGSVLFSGKIYTAGKYFTQPPVVTVATNFKSDSKVGEGFCSSSSFDNSRWNLKANISNAMHPHSNVGEGRRLQRKHGVLSKERKMNLSLHTKKVKIFKDKKGVVVAYFCVDWYIFRPRVLPEGRSSEICGAFLLLMKCWRTAICLVGPTSGNLQNIFCSASSVSNLCISLQSRSVQSVLAFLHVRWALLKIYFSDSLGIHLLFLLVFPYVR